MCVYERYKKDDKIAFLHSKWLHSCLTHWDPVDCSLPGSSVSGFSRQEYWNGLPFPSPGDLSNPGIEPVPLLHWKAGSFPLAPPGKPNTLTGIWISCLQSPSSMLSGSCACLPTSQASLPASSCCFTAHPPITSNHSKTGNENINIPQTWSFGTKMFIKN